MSTLQIDHKPATVEQHYRAAGYWNDDTLYQLLAEWARSTPDKAAIVTEASQWTYAQWHDQVLRLASALQELGIDKGDVVAVQLPNSPEFLLAFLAIAAIGAVTQTLHMPYRSAELRFLLSHSGAKGFLCLSRVKEDSPAQEGVRLQADIATLKHVIVVGQPVAGTHAFSHLLQHTPAVHLPPVSGDDAFLLLYTSGTTGNPKGVPIKYCWFMSNARIAVSDWQITDQDVLLSVAPYTHLYGIWTILLALYGGATSALLPAFTPPALVQCVARLKPTGVFAAPAHIAAMLHSGWWERLEAAGMRFIGQAGSIVPDHIARAIDEKLVHGGVMQLFGMSELQAGCYTRPGDPPDVRRYTSGTPPAGMELRIVDGAGQDVPPGEEGQLLFRGIAVFTGYLHNAEATRAAFTPDGWFLTGDTARLTPAGHLKITGRVKDIINRGGIKYHPMEVEEVVSRMDGVEMCAVIAYPDAILGERACIFLQQRADAHITLEDITAALDTAGLAKYKWPERLAFVDQMPLTPTRKIIRGELAKLLS
jgi:non-ribosomal peptide synthetase component E (peptide arylation enzyme)